MSIEGQGHFLTLAQGSVYTKIKLDFLSNCCADLNQTLYESLYVTMMAATPIYGKNPSKFFFSRTDGPISTKLGMQHLGLLPSIVCSNDDPGVTLTYYGKVKFGFF